MKSTSKAVEQDLAQLTIEAHGGLERWKRFTTLSIHGINDGVHCAAKGKAGVLDDVCGGPGSPFPCRLFR